MTQVFKTYSRLKAPLRDVEDTVESGITLPNGIADLDIKRVNGKLHIQSVPTDESIGQYTPTALIKGGLSDELVVVEDDGTVTHQSVGQYQQSSNWGQMQNEEDELDTTTLTYVDLYGRGDEVLVHDLLRAEMFDVLCQLATVSISGHVKGLILNDDGDLTPVWYDAGGEEIDAEVSIEEVNSRAAEQEASSGMNWTQHS